MKKGSAILLVLTVVFIGFVAGMLVGRSIGSSDTTIQVLAEQTATQATSKISDSAVTVEQRININTASAALLDSLPGIGPVLAQRIVDYRTENGPYTKTTDISKVEGIGPEKLLSILELITVEE